ncbi:glycine-rich extracellular protein 1 [Tiliqua scincoides]|uniref:glycine-rich extracellular protein 1 n=1 Tax=Tiliqua scincoides TaxID=71010 RepID=UPI0034622703
MLGVSPFVGAQTPYGSQLGGPVGDPAAAKYGGAGQLSYNGQAEAAGLGGDYDAGRYEVPQSPYGPQTGGPGGISVDPAAINYAGPYSAVAPGGYGGQLGPGQALGEYGAKESKYGLNGFLGNGYRGRCPSGKC